MSADKNRCWYGGPWHDWVPEGDGWRCDCCQKYDEDGEKR